MEAQPQTKDEKFMQALKNNIGKPVEVVSGVDAYTFPKEKHLNLLKNSGMYLILENLPYKRANQIYDKAFFVPAKIIDANLTQNDPTKVKSSFHMGGNLMRTKFNGLSHKIYEFQNMSFIIKIFPMATSQRSFKFIRKEMDTLVKDKGYFIFLCMSTDGILLDVITKKVNEIDIKEGHASRDLLIELSKAGWDLLYAIQNPKVEDTPTPDVAPAHAQTELPHTPIHEGLATTLHKRLFLQGKNKITITIPDDDGIVLLDCTINRITTTPYK